MLTLAKGLKQRKIRIFKAPKNQFSEFNIDNEVKPRQFQAHRDHFRRSVHQFFDLRLSFENRHSFVKFFFRKAQKARKSAYFEVKKFEKNVFYKSSQIRSM